MLVNAVMFNLRAKATKLPFRIVRHDSTYFMLDAEGNAQCLEKPHDIKKAIDILKTNENCTNCVNCRNCSGCESCEDCLECVNCSLTKDKVGAVNMYKEKQK